MTRFEELRTQVIDWANERGILASSDPETQLLKTVSELGELADNVAKNRLGAAMDDVGDIAVTLILFCELYGEFTLKYNGDLVTPGSIKTNTHRLVSDIGYISHQIWKEKTTPQLVNLHQVDIDMVMESLERIAELLGSDLIECLQIAYDEIAKRKGQMINGIFVKAGDE